MKTSVIKFSLVICLFGFLAGSCNRKPEPVITTPPPVVVIPKPPPVPIPPPTPPYPTPSGNPPQFVVMAFDGSYSLSMWEKTLDFAALMKSQNHPVHFTYFLSGVYFLNYRKADKYQPPKKSAGSSLIGFADSNLDVEKRVAFVNRAISEDHEIGSHANGHFDGTSWTLDEWQQELDQFHNLTFHIVENNDVSGVDAYKYTINLPPGDLIGFRAPSLGRNENMNQALLKSGYKYDTSGTGTATSWPTQLKNGLWEFPLASIKYADTNSYLLAMDYNFYYKQSKAHDVTKKGEEQWNQFYQDTYTSYLNYFQNNYDNKRAPVYIGSHFSEWNDGVYWEAMRDFASNVCIMPEVYCVDFKELMGYLEEDKWTK